mmetsp:Transcript_24887/g.54268  ORF Transcript_24887/g.54268 Transcript_24887/m.54268 type:complete len:100 (+) Transcript_24887:196-495(+)
MRAFLFAFAIIGAAAATTSSASNADRVVHTPQELHPQKDLFHRQSHADPNRKPPREILRALKGGRVTLTLDEMHSVVRKVHAESVTPYIYMAGLPVGAD